MKRRKFNLLAGTSVAALMGPNIVAFAQAAPSDFATLSKTTLTPVGAERAGNAAGTIPSWTGGMTAVPEGWDPITSLPPDFFAGDQLLYKVDASNLAQHTDLLSDGVQTLLQKQPGFSLQVYPTHRTAAAPQWVYDNIVQNASRATLDPAGGRFGFSGGYGGIPFPVPGSDPEAAGAQIMWNHISRWSGTNLAYSPGSWVISGGNRVCSCVTTNQYYYPYYDPNGSLATFNGFVYYQRITFTAPANTAGEIVLVHTSIDPAALPDNTWQLELGLGRVRKAPQLQYDTPASSTNGLTNYDEYYGFTGAMDEYDWKLIGKREMLIPYNTNKLCHVTAATMLGPNYINPNVLRWELHRVWVVEATVHPGRRNVLARRRFYLDEDTWQVALTDAWDASGNIYHHQQMYNMACPQLPGTVATMDSLYNLQTDSYGIITSISNDSPMNTPFSFDPIPMSVFNSQSIASSSAY